MSADPIILQSSVAIAISLGLVVFTLIRWERAPLHTLLVLLLSSVTVWLLGASLKIAGESEWLRLVGLHIETVAVIFMPPLFLIAMAYFARSALFEQSFAPSIGLLAVSSVFFLGYLTDGHHHLFFADREAALAGEMPTVWGGPLFWASQLWTATVDLLAFGYCGAVLLRGPTRAERGRAAMIFTAVLIPTLAHVVYLLKWLPIDFSLAPGTLAFTAVFFVQGVHRYGLLGGQTIVRHDLIEHLDDGLVLANEHGVVLDANASAEATLGTSRSDLRGNELVRVLAALGESEAARQLGERIVGLPLDGSRFGGEVVTPDGRFIDVTGGAVPPLGSQPSGRFVSLTDRTVQRRNERLLRERQKLESVGVLAAGVAHEVNNPLAYVRANLVHLGETAALLAKGDVPVEPEDVAEMPELVAESVEGLDRIAKIVESMLRFSRVPDEKHRVVDVNELVDEAMRLAALQRGSALQHGSAVHARHSADVPALVSGSPERLVQVLLNLFLNARQATGDQQDALIEAEVTRDEADVVVRVRDNGPGIPPELQQRIFDPFFTTRGPDQGTGLGLSIAFDIVREHHGTLELASQPGEGTCFTIRLPAAG